MSRNSWIILELNSLGTYGGRLRTPLTVPQLSHPNPPETGILTGSAAAPYAVVIAGSLTADARLRVQVEHNVQDDILAFKLIDMQDGGAEGMIVPATGNGEFVLPGFSGSAVSSLSIRVDDYSGFRLYGYQKKIKLDLSVFSIFLHTEVCHDLFY